MSQEVTHLCQSFVGVDLHKCTVSLAAVDASGADVARLTISTKSVEKIEHWLLTLPRPSHLAAEACPFVEWFIDRCQECVDRIDIADATELANRRGKRRKNDRNDAADVARRLARGECPLGFIADPPLMQLYGVPVPSRATTVPRTRRNSISSNSSKSTDLQGFRGWQR